MFGLKSEILLNISVDNNLLIDLQITFQANELFYRDYEKMGLILKIMVRKFLQQFKAKTTLSPSQTLGTPCCQGNLSTIIFVNLRVSFSTEIVLLYLNRPQLSKLHFQPSCFLLSDFHVL